MDDLPDLKPVKVKCSQTNCDEGQHCYRPKKRKDWKALNPEPECRNCGDKGVDMAITRATTASDPGRILAELGREFIRAHFLAAPIDAQGRRELRRFGVGGVRQRAAKQLAGRVGKLHPYDGRQTPMEGSVLNLAQHATATCCRRCAWYWYGLPRKEDYDEAQLAFCDGLIQAYLDQRQEELEAIAAPPVPGAS